MLACLSLSRCPSVSLSLSFDLSLYISIFLSLSIHLSIYLSQKRISDFDRRALQPERLWDKGTNLLHEHRTRKANIRTLLHLEAHLAYLIADHNARRKEARVALDLLWRKPREFGACRCPQFTCFTSTKVQILTQLRCLQNPSLCAASHAGALQQR